MSFTNNDTVQNLEKICFIKNILKKNIPLQLLISDLGPDTSYKPFFLRYFDFTMTIFSNLVK